MTRRLDDRQMDLFAWAAARPIAKVISALPRLEKKLQAERYAKEKHHADTPVLPLRRHA